MKLTEEQVKHVAKLANLELTSREVKKFQEQLSAVLDYMESLGQVETEEIEQTSQVMNLKNVLREDETGSSLTQEEALSGTSAKDKSMFRTKAIFKE